MSGGDVALRGFLVQTLIALLEALRDDPPWTHVTLEPDVDSEKVDILWAYRDGTKKAVQVKSSKNPFSKTDVERWAGELQKSKAADGYELCLVGPAPPAIANLGRVGEVEVPTPKNLDLPGFKSDAAHRLHSLLPKLGLPTRTAEQLDDLVALLIENLASGSVDRQSLSREGLAELLRRWLSHSGTGVRIVRVFVACPKDAQDERTVLEQVVASINSIEGDAHQVRLELRSAEFQPPQPGAAGRPVAADTPADGDLFLGIVSAAFDERGTENMFRQAWDRWQPMGSPWVKFYFDDDPRVPRTKRAAYDTVCDLRDQLEPRGVVGGYTGVRDGEESFQNQVSEHLRRTLHMLEPPKAGTGPRSDPTKYLRDVLDKSAWIDIRGLQVGTGRANRFPIEDLYISLTTTGAVTRGPEDAPGAGTQERRGVHGPDGLAGEEPREVPLQTALRSDRLVVVGQPGSGKTTFLRRIAFALCQTRLGDVADAADQRLGIRDRTFPVYVRINELAEHVKRSAHAADAPRGEDAAAWLPHYLAAASAAASWGLDARFFQQQLADGVCTVLLDGLDEAPDRLVREQMSRLIGNVTTAYRDCRYVVTSRPVSYTGATVLAAFDEARIDPLSDAAVETFLTRWCGAVYRESVAAATAHCDELLAAVRGRPPIRRMARNPVMLTALAVVHWNERRLPEQRADLYDSIITWLSRSREQRAGRETADRTIVLLQELALAMQDDPEGRQTQVSKRWGAERIAAELAGAPVTKDTIAAAERFLDEEEVDSGIIVGRGSELAYWHLTFQEFLAAKAIASRLDDQQRQILLADRNKVYTPDWREVVLLYAGALHQQGKAKVAGFLGGLLDGLGPSPSLADQARCAGLIGSILQDLTPLKYEFADPRYHGLLDAVTAIFDPQRSQAVPLAERIAAADALGGAGDARLDLRREDYWVAIPAGKFLMGAQSDDPKAANYDPESTDTDQWRETPHEVYLDAYCIARYPVTVGQYGQFVEDEGYQDERWWTAGGFGEYSEPDEWERQVAYPSRPVVRVSWWEAKAFCAWAGFRLATEAEWERAARGPEGRKYPWGDDPIDEQRANYAKAIGQPNIGHPTPVGIYPLGSTAEGICDLAGNAWEWCEDGFAEYTVESVANPHGNPEGSDRVLRGGCWAGGAEYCRAAYRNGGVPSNRYVNLGFRLARTVPTPSR
ncbi:MAG: SUMF1/EgtB/PvdO family nonheme iron enzyme [Pirellulaceae bacterium]|nr:SUMF1/EgtB/PvdO family nonheme iron enzyme [Pirellulaceae bacterium]